MEACYARCNCWTDFPDMGGQITHEVKVINILLQIKESTVNCSCVGGRPLPDGHLFLQL